jgi:hypothetical protein
VRTTRVAASLVFVVLGVVFGVALGALVVTVRAQDAPLNVELSADSVELAEVFDLVVHVAVPSGSAVYFPDTLPTTAEVESFAPVEWRAERAGDGATLRLTYALIPFGEGDIAVPAPEIIIAPVTAAEGGEALPGGSVLADWADVPRATGRTVRRVDVATPSIWIQPVRFGGALGDGVSPRGPDDVLGTSWSWPSVALVGFFSSILAAAGVAQSRRWLAGRGAGVSTAGGRPATAEEARRAALAAIERLIAEGPHATDREKAVYAASSDVVRGYAARLAPDWVPGLTSTELMQRVEGTAAGKADVARVMAIAERVKFGRLRTGSDALGAHLAELRTWLSEARS